MCDRSFNAGAGFVLVVIIILLGVGAIGAFIGFGIGYASHRADFERDLVSKNLGTYVKNKDSFKFVLNVDKDTKDEIP